MKVLAINTGSSSVKYRLFDCSNGYRLLKRGIAEKIGAVDSSIGEQVEGHPLERREIALPDSERALNALLEGIDLGEVDLVGHRVVHGGEAFKGPALIDSATVEEIAKLSKFAPLHCRPNILAIEILQRRLPAIPHIAVFDTSLHSSMDYKSFLYGLPIELYEKHKIRRYGFHGINHSYAASRAADFMGREPEELKLITCHLGSGSSITAFERGKSIDNTMGLTPLEGLIMGTRSGDIDPSLVIYLIEELGLSTKEATELLNKKSGLYGIAGKSDMREIIEEAKEGDTFSKVAIELFVYRVQKSIGAYAAALNGVDAIAFTGGIGENSPYIRSLIAKNLTYLGFFIDERSNGENKTLISKEDSSPLLAIPADEEREIAKICCQFICKRL